MASAAALLTQGNLKALTCMKSYSPRNRLLLAVPAISKYLWRTLSSFAANGRHSLKERLARWLLMMRDRSDDDVMAIGQSLLAEMLGVQRPSITHAIAGLEGAGLVERGRQQITILDRQGLIEASCECYRLVRERVAFHLPRTYP